MMHACVLACNVYMLMYAFSNAPGASRGVPSEIACSASTVHVKVRFAKYALSDT